MSDKRVPIGPRPRAEESVGSPVTEAQGANTPPTSAAPVMKRLTIDVPEDLHRRPKEKKVKAALEAVEMADVLAWIAERYESQPSGASTPESSRGT